MLKALKKIGQKLFGVQQITNLGVGDCNPQP